MNFVINKLILTGIVKKQIIKISHGGTMAVIPVLKRHRQEGGRFLRLS